MPKAHLTDIVVQRLKLPGTYFDATTPAFGIRVGKHRKTWIVMRGRERVRTRIGHYPSVTLAEARKHAHKLLGEEPQKKSALTFEQARAKFFEKWRVREWWWKSLDLFGEIVNQITSP